ncbi:MAG TPA: NnrU family protein, partial [Pirellulales bacterium]
MSAGWAAAIDLGLLLLFGLQHSIMARPAFKRVWTKFVPEQIERSTYVLFSNLAVILLIWHWQSIPLIVWNMNNEIGRTAILTLFAIGLLLVPGASLMINHFDLFGLRQVWLNLRDRQYTALPFHTPMLYSIVRHPLYVGWFMVLWITPTMSVGHLLFASLLTSYIVIASKIEERDLVQYFGRDYQDYQRRVPAFVPRMRFEKSSTTTEA